MYNDYEYNDCQIMRQIRERRILLRSPTCILIVNPTSGREQAVKYAPKMEKVLKEQYQSVCTRKTEKSGDAEQFAENAANAGMDVFCMGGDGTIHEVINGLARSENNPSFGFVPFGTVNDLARALHIPRTPHAAINMLRDAVTSRISIGRINDRYFVNIVAAGLLPEAMSRVSIKDKTRLGSLAYFLKAFQVLQKQKSYDFRIEMEDGTVIRSASPLLAGMLTDSAGSFRNILPPTTAGAENYLRLALFRDFSFVDLLAQAPGLIAGNPLSPDTVTVIDVKKARITLSGGDNLSTNVDGEPGPDFPLDLEILPGRIRVFVPKNSSNSLFHIPDLMKYFTGLMEKKNFRKKYKIN